MRLLKQLDKIVNEVRAQSQSERNLRACETTHKLPPVHTRSVAHGMDWWLSRVRQAAPQGEVFVVIEEFRPGSWTDEQRGQMAHAYHARLNMLPVIDTMLDHAYSNKLASHPFLNQACAAKSIDEIASVLKDFNQGNFTLDERAAMSIAYTPVAIKLIAAENRDRSQTLEDLAALCWTKRSNTTYGIDEVTT